jgi:hypothetical protein
MMHKVLYILLSLLVAPSLIYSQSIPELQWKRCYGGNQIDEVRSMISTSDGGYIFAGATRSSKSGDVLNTHQDSNIAYDIWIMKLTGTGAIQWQKCLGGTNSDMASSIIQTKSGEYVIAGYTNSSDGDISFQHGGSDFWLIKLDTIGNIIWQRTYGGKNAEWAMSMVQTADEGFMLTGQTMSRDGDVAGNPKIGAIWVVKLNTLGVLEWQNTFGDISTEQIYSVVQTMEGGYIFAGETNSSSVPGSHEGGDAWVVKLDSVGSVQWQKCFGGSDRDFAHSIIQTTDGGYIFAGGTASVDGDITNNNGSSDAWLVKLDLLGNIEWQKCYGGNNSDGAFSIIQTLDGGYAFTGNMTFFDEGRDFDKGELWIEKLDAFGNSQWRGLFGGINAENGLCILQSTTGEYTLAGFTYSDDGDVSGNHGDEDIWIIKLGASLDVSQNTLLTNRLLNLKVFPNPNTKISNLTFTLPSPSQASICLTNSAGELIWRNFPLPATSKANEIPINLETLPTGNYFLTLKVGDLLETVQIEHVK